jgi:hypothetical protein
VRPIVGAGDCPGAGKRGGGIRDLKCRAVVELDLSDADGV